MKQYLNRIHCRIRWWGIIILMLPILFWVWMAAEKPFISVFNGDVLRYIISGKIFTEKFDTIHAGMALDQQTIGKWLFWFTFMTITSLPYVMALRWLSDRSRKSGYWAFGISIIILCTFLLCILSWPLIWLIQYVNSMGFTPKRVFGLFYLVCVVLFVIGFAVWSFRKPKELNDSKQIFA